MRSTQKYINGLLDRIKWDLNLKSRADASRYFYSVLSKAFQNKGYSLSYYKDNMITVTKNHFVYHAVPYDMLWMQNTFIKQLESNLN